MRLNLYRRPSPDGRARDGLHVSTDHLTVGDRTRAMRILVTGGAGYIGLLTAGQHLADGPWRRRADDLRNGHPAAAGALPLVVGDVRDIDLVASTIDRHEIDAVVHFAGLKSVRSRSPIRGLYFDHNLGGRVAPRGDAGPASAAWCSRRRARSTAPGLCAGRRVVAIRPICPYGESKSLFERCSKPVRSRSALAVASLRYFNAIGAAGRVCSARTGPWHRTVIPRLVQTAAIGRGPLGVFGTTTRRPTARHP